MRIIKITQMGDTGNCMFQYMFAKMLQRRVSDAIVTGFDIPIWNMNSSGGPELPSDAMMIRGGHEFNLAELAEYLKADESRAIDFGGYGMRLEYYGSSEQMGAFFRPPSDLRVPALGAEFIVINVRGMEPMTNLHPDYIPVPISLYERIIKETALTPVFMGRIGDDPYSLELRRRFKNQIFLDRNTPLHDFETIRRASNIVISVGSFSWLAAWFSYAQTIHVPLLGFLNPTQRPDVDLLPKGDRRYRFYPGSVRKWGATREDMLFAIS
jgi:hypothetical protein